MYGDKWYTLMYHMIDTAEARGLDITGGQARGKQLTAKRVNAVRDSSLSEA